MFEKIKMAIIAAAGQATRMWPASKMTPKELFPLGRIPVIIHVLWELLGAGIEKIVIVAAPHNRQLIEGLLDPLNVAPAKLSNDPLVRHFQQSLGCCSITVIEQTGGYGNGTPLRLAMERFGRQPCVYAFGDDIIFGENATRGLLAVHERTGCPVLGAQEIPPTARSSFGILECERRDDDDYVTRIVEKPSAGETLSNLASFGRYVVTPHVLEMLSVTQPGRDGEIWFTDAVIAFLREGGDVCASRLSRGRWFTVGDPHGYAQAVQAATEEQLGYSIRRHLQEGESRW